MRTVLNNLMYEMMGIGAMIVVTVVLFLQSLKSSRQKSEQINLYKSRQNKTHENY
jgi:hypothetical protein